MKLKASLVVKFGYVMLFLHMLGAAYYFFNNDKEVTLLLLAACVGWIFGIFIWTQVERQEREDK